MQHQVQVSFQDIEPSDSIESLIRDKIAKLEEFHGRIMSCRVAISQPRARGRNGHLFKVRIDLTIPGGKEIVASRDPGVDHSHESLLVAIRDAFDAVSRQLDEYVDRRNPNAMKHGHASPPHGRITQIFHTKDYGFIRSETNEEVYFHRNAVTDGSFDSLSVGTEVRFAMEENESPAGPQATSVTPVGKQNRVLDTPPVTHSA